MKKQEITEMLVLIVFVVCGVIFLNTTARAADLSLDYEKSSLNGSYNGFFDSFVTQRIGAEMAFNITKTLRLSFGAGNEKVNYVYFDGYTFLSQILILPDGTVVGAHGKSVYTRRSESLSGPYYKLRLTLKI